MARRSDHSREELYALILDSARRIVEEDGLSGLTARRVASSIGYAPGTIYNLFSNLDDLILHLRGSVLDQLYASMSSIPIEGKSEKILLVIAKNYIKFVSNHSNLWDLVIQHKLPPDAQVPNWYREKSARLLNLVESAIAEFFSPGQEEQRLHHARVLWASLYGICSLHLADKLAKTDSVELMTESLIVKYVEGLRNEFVNLD